MLKSIVFITLVALFSNSSKANYEFIDYAPTAQFIGYATLLTLTLVIKNTLSHHSKQFANSNSKISIALRSLSDACNIFFVKLSVDAIFPGWENIIPEWIKPRKNNLEDAKLKQQLEEIKLNAVARDGLIQKDRIDSLKEQLFMTRLESNLSQLNQLLKTHTSFFGSNNLVEASQVLLKTAEDALNLYPGFTNENMSFIATPAFNPLKTGESYVYNEELVQNLASQYHFKKRIDPKTIDYLKESLEKLSKKKSEKTKIAYFQHFFYLLDIHVPLDGALTDLNSATLNSEL